MNYLVFGKECAPTGQLHYQGYVQFKNRMTQMQITRNGVLENCWRTIARGSAMEASEYCKKDGEFYEYGTITLNGRPRGSSDSEQRKRRRQNYDDVVNGRKKVKQCIDEAPEDLDWIKKLGEYVPARKEAAHVLYLWGATGKGKTHSTHNVLDKLEVSYYKKSPGTKWFDGYQDQDVLILEEFTSCFTITKFLTLCDRNPPPQETKGGHTNISARFIIILSNLSPEDQYKGDDIPVVRKEAYLRRIDTSFCVNDMSHDEIEATIETFIRSNQEVDMQISQVSSDTVTINPTESEVEEGENLFELEL